MGSLVSSVLGMDNGAKAGKAAIAAGKEYAKDVYFKPYTMTTGFGGSAYDPETGAYTSQLAAPFMGVQSTALTGAQNILGGLSSFDPAQRQAELYQQQAALLQPTLAQQQVQAQERMFGSGRLGLKLAGEAVGAGSNVGQVNPDAFGLGAAQSQMLGQLAVQSREQALQEGQALTEMATGLLAQGVGVAELETNLMKLGIDAESARAMAAASAGQLGTGGYQTAAQTAMAQDQAMGSLWGGIAGGLMAGGMKNLGAGKGFFGG